MAVKSSQTRSSQVHCHYAVKAWPELCIDASLVGHPLTPMQWFEIESSILLGKGTVYPGHLLLCH